MNTYIHLTTPERAAMIMDSMMLMMNPPFAKTGIDAVCAIHIDGRIVASVLPKAECLVAIVFTTNMPHDYVYPEEAVWHADVPFASAYITPVEKASSLLTNTITD